MSTVQRNMSKHMSVETLRRQRCRSGHSDPFTCNVQRSMSKTCLSKRYDGSVAEVARVIRDNIVIGGRSLAQHSESHNVRKAEFDTKTSVASNGFLQHMSILGSVDALAIVGRALVVNNTLQGHGVMA